MRLSRSHLGISVAVVAVVLATLGVSSGSAELYDRRPASASIAPVTVAQASETVTSSGALVGAPTKSLVLTEARGGNTEQVPGASGQVNFRDDQAGRLVMQVELRGLRARQAYLLTLSGKQDHPSNQFLRDCCKRWGPLGYQDVSTLMTDRDGNFIGTFSVELPSTAYEVTLLVKRAADSYPSALQNDFFRFTVQSASANVQPAPRPLPSQPLLATHPGDDKRLRPVDWIFLVDTSASMSGQGPGAANIFPTVRNVLADFINKTRDEDSLRIFTFSEASQPRLSYDPIGGDERRKLAVDDVSTLLADGRRTHTGAALKDGLDQAASFSARQPPRPAAIILLTDGMEDVRGIANPTPISRAIELIPDRRIPYVFYVSLGTRVDPGLRKFVDETNRKAQKADEGRRGEIFSDPNAASLAKVIERIRSIPRPEIKASPSPLNIGDVDGGVEASAKLSVRLLGNSQSAVSVVPRWVVPNSPDLQLAPLETLELTGSRAKDLPISITPSASAKPGERELILQLNPTSRDQELSSVRVRVHFNVRGPVTVLPSVLEVGTVSPGSKAGPFAVTISSPADGAVRISPNDVPAGVEVKVEPATLLSVSPHKKSQIQISISVDKDSTVGSEPFSLSVKPESSSPAMLPTPQNVLIKMTIAWPWWKPITDFLWRWSWLLFIALLLTCAAIYFSCRWLSKEELPCETPLLRGLFRRHRPQPAGRAYLQKEGGGTIDLADDVPIRSGGLLPEGVTAAAEIYRRGEKHCLRVVNPPVSICNLGNDHRTDLHENDEMELEHGCRISFWGTDPEQPLQIFTYRNLMQGRIGR